MKWLASPRPLSLLVSRYVNHSNFCLVPVYHLLFNIFWQLYKSTHILMADTLADPAPHPAALTTSVPALQAGNKTNHRRIIICCDGTFNDRETQDPFTNVSKIVGCIGPIDDRNDQRRYHQLPIYLDGIGTGTTKWGGRWDGATGASMDLFLRIRRIII
jgi:hypothetical protein